MVAGVQQPLPAAHHAHASGFPVRPRRIEPVGQHVQAARLDKPLPLAAVSARSSPAARLADRQGQPVLDRAHTRLKILNVRELTAPGQRPLIMGGLRDTARPAGGRPRRQGPLALGPQLAVVLQAGHATRLQIPRGQRAQMVTHQAQHAFVLGGQVLETVTNRDRPQPGHSLMRT
jgi:hypothetical protein